MGFKRKYRKKVCTKCGRRLWLQEFYRMSNGWLSGACKECCRKEKNEWYANNRKVPDRMYHDERGRLLEHKGCSTRLFWSAPMEEKLRRLFPTTKNDDLAIEFDMSARTIVRKARELGLEKDREWMLEHKRQNCRLMRVINLCHRGNSGQFKKGQHASPKTEFKKKAIC